MMRHSLTYVKENVQQKIPEAVGFASAKSPFYGKTVSDNNKRMVGFGRGQEAFAAEEQQRLKRDAEKASMARAAEQQLWAHC